MRVLVQCQQIAPGFSCGVENFTFGLLNALAEADESTRFEVAIPRGTRTAWVEQVPERQNLAFREVAATASLIGISRWGQRHPLIAAGRRALRSSELLRRGVRPLRLRIEHRAVRDFKPDVTYYPFHLVDAGAANAVVTVHDFRSHMPDFENELERSLVARNIDLADAAVTSWLHPFVQLDEFYPEASQKAFMIPFPPMIPSLARAGNSTVGDDGPPLLIYPASTARHKNHLALIEAVARLLPHRPVRLVCTGTKVAPWYQEAAARAEELGISDHVQFAGFVPAEEVARLYEQAAMVVVPSLWEAASGAVFEAFHYGKPVACSDIPPIRTQVEFADGEVRFFDPHDPDAIASAIEDILATPETYRAGSERARRRLETLSWRRTAAEYLQVFEWVASGRRTPPPIILSSQMLEAAGVGE